MSGWLFTQNLQLIDCLSKNITRMTRQNFTALLCTAPLPYITKMIFTQATIDSLTNNKTKNAHHETQSVIAWVNSYLDTYCKGFVPKNGQYNFAGETAKSTVISKSTNQAIISFI